METFLTPIPVLIVGSFFPAIYYTFYCDPVFRPIYLLGISLAGLGIFDSFRSDSVLIFLLCRVCLHCSESGVLKTHAPRSTNKSIHWPRTIIRRTRNARSINARISKTPLGDGSRIYGLIWRALHPRSAALVSASRKCSFSPSLSLHLCSANRIPERFSPGTFDYFFASHQIFHIMVVLAALAHYGSVLTDIEHWHGRQAGTCSV